MSTEQQRLDAEAMGIPVEALSGCSQESPMPMSINEQYDAGQRQMLCYTKLEEECDLQHKFALERQAKLDEIYHVCVTKMQRTANTEVHAVLNTIKGIIVKTTGAKP